MTRSKILNLSLLFSSLFGYLEWGGNNHAFLFEAEADLFVNIFSDPVSALHPFTILPMLGQVILLITLFQKSPGKKMSLFAIGTLGLLLGFMLIAGVLAGNFKTIMSTLPFLFLAIVTIKNMRIR